MDKLTHYVVFAQKPSTHVKSLFTHFLHFEDISQAMYLATQQVNNNK